MADFLILAVIAVLAGMAVNHIRKAKKNGVKCIGCPEGGACPRACGKNADCRWGEGESSSRE